MRPLEVLFYYFLAEVKNEFYGDHYLKYLQYLHYSTSIDTVALFHPNALH